MQKENILFSVINSISRILRRTRTRDKKQIFVAGDSHSRAFSYNPNFFPLFLGPGKEINFISDANKEHVHAKLQHVEQSIRPSKVLTCFGEPDTRWFVGKGWYPWKNEVKLVVNDFRAELDRSADRYIDVVNRLRGDFGWDVLILNVTPTIRVEQNHLAVYLNERLAALCESNSIKFLSINERLMGDDLILDESFCGDTVHLNNKIQPLVEELLLDLGLIETLGYSEDQSWEHKQVHEAYKFDSRFGCYTMKGN